MPITDSTMGRADGGSAMATETEIPQIIFPIFTDDVTEQALGIAVDLSAHHHTNLTIAGMEQVPKQTPLDHPRPSVVSQQRAQEGLGHIREMTGKTADITLKSRVGHDLAHMILEEAHNSDDGTIVMEQTESATAAKSLLSDPLESVFESGVADVALTTGTEHLDSIGSILVPVTGGPHSGRAVDVANAIAAENSAWIELFHVVEPDPSEEARESGQQYLEAAMARLEGYEQAETWLYEADDMVEAIIEQTPFYDITIIGAPRENRLRRFIFGSKTKEVQKRADSTVVTVHAKDADRSWYEAWLRQST